MSLNNPIKNFQLIPLTKSLSPPLSLSLLLFSQPFSELSLHVDQFHQGFINTTLACANDLGGISQTVPVEGRLQQAVSLELAGCLVDHHGGSGGDGGGGQERISDKLINY